MTGSASLSDAVSTKSSDESIRPAAGDERGGVGETKRQLKPRHMQVRPASMSEPLET